MPPVDAGRRSGASALPGYHAGLALALQGGAGAARFGFARKAGGEQAGEAARGHQRLAGPGKRGMAADLAPQLVGIARDAEGAELHAPAALLARSERGR